MAYVLLPPLHVLGRLRCAARFALPVPASRGLAQRETCWPKAVIVVVLVSERIPRKFRHDNAFLTVTIMEAFIHFLNVSYLELGTSKLGSD